MRATPDLARQRGVFFRRLLTAARPAVALRPEEVRAVVAFRERAGLWSEGRRAEIADHASELTGGKGPAGVSRMMAIAHWLQEKR